MASYGMNEGQKARTRVYLDDFKKNNGGCLLCQKKIAEYSFMPASADGKIQLQIYGLCLSHARHSDADELAEQEVAKILPIVQEGEINKPIFVEITFNPNGETLKFKV
jgi:hypothetical protein